MSKEDNGAFAGSFSRFFVFTVENPTETAVAEVGDDGLDSGADRTTDSSAGVAADGFADSGDSVADLLENALNYPCYGVISGDGSEALFDDFFTFANDVGGEFAFGNSAGHHGDLAGFKGVGEEVK